MNYLPFILTQVRRILVSLILGLLLARAMFAADKSEDLSLSVGGGFVTLPSYEGSSNYDFFVLPYINLNYKNILFVENNKGAGLYLLHHKLNGLNLDIDAHVRHRLGKDVEARGIDGYGQGASLGLGADLGFMTDWSFNLNGDLGVFSENKGFEVKADLVKKQKFTQNSSGQIYAGTSWASNSYMDHAFDVSAVESAASGLRAFDASSGFKDLHLGLNAKMDLGNSLALKGDVESKYLIGDAADSPLTDHGSELQFQTGLYLTYSF